MKEDVMSTIGRLNEAGFFMRKTHQLLLTEEDGIAQQFKGWHDAFNSVEAENDKAEFPEDAIPMLSVDDSQKVNAGIAPIDRAGHRSAC
ncbi:hypothetical protein AAC387_Pa12g1135 [Persea americana]